MNADKSELTGIKGIAKKVWKYGLWFDYYRRKELEAARDRIEQSGNIYDGEIEDLHATQQAKEAILNRFLIEDEDTIHTAAGETKDRLDTPESAGFVSSIKDLLRAYVRGEIDDAGMEEEQHRLFMEHQGMDRDESRLKYTNNLSDIAKNLKDSFEHSEALARIDNELQFVQGQAKTGVRTEAQFTTVDNLVDRIQQTSVGRLVNETTLSSAVAICTTLTTGLVTRFARSKAASWITFGGSALVGGVVSAARESRMLERERAEHIRMSAQGKVFQPETSERRTEMEKFRYETREANLLADTVEQSLYQFSPDGKKESKELTSEAFQTAVDELAEIEARIQLSDRYSVQGKPDKHIDLVGYSSITQVEQERLRLDLVRAKAKIDLRAKASTAEFDATILGEHDFDSYLK
ncbi:MAG: hypothetical protein AAB870_00605, partial [Patescibacteria group bacterium]